jgi:hypothetical protein
MKVKDLIYDLSKQDPESEVNIKANVYFPCQCGEIYCRHNTTEEKEFSINRVVSTKNTVDIECD